VVRYTNRLLATTTTTTTTARGQKFMALASRNLSILLSIVFAVAVRVTRTVQGSRFTSLTLRSQLYEDR